MFEIIPIKIASVQNRVDAPIAETQPQTQPAENIMPVINLKKIDEDIEPELESKCEPKIETESEHERELETELETEPECELEPEQNKLFRISNTRGQKWKFNYAYIGMAAAILSTFM